jgi:hypothetical protein
MLKILYDAGDIVFSTAILGKSGKVGLAEFWENVKDEDDYMHSPAYKDPGATVPIFFHVDGAEVTAQARVMHKHTTQVCEWEIVAFPVGRKTGLTMFPVDLFRVVSPAHDEPNVFDPLLVRYTTKWNSIFGAGVHSSALV